MEGKKNILLYAGIAAVVIVLVGYLLTKTSFAASNQINETVSSQELAALSSIANNQTLANNVSIADYIGFPYSAYFKSAANSVPLTYNGKPELLYVGADFCPYCAATRWPLILALMRFGNLTGIRYMQSSATDVYPNTPTFTFYPNYSYTSSYIVFRAFETETRTSQPLQQLDNQSEAIYYKYGNAIPFIDYGNRTIQDGSVLLPTAYAGQSWPAITSELAKPNSDTAQTVIGAANLYTAEICAMVNNTAPVCSQPYVKTAEKTFSI